MVMLVWNLACLFACMHHTFFGAESFEGVRLGQAWVGYDLGSQFDGQVDGAVALWQLAVIEESQQLG